MVLSIRRWRVAALVAVALTLFIYYISTISDNLAGAGFALPRPNDRKQHWKKLPERFPVQKPQALPTGSPIAIPKIQAVAPAEDAAAKKLRLERLAAVKESFEHSWKGYKKHAWMKDEVRPVNGGFRQTFGGWAATVVDTLDTLWIMGLTKEFEAAVKAVSKIDFTTTETNDINVFETTIRYLGGLLAAHDLSKGRYPVLLKKAKEVGDLLMCAFDTPNRWPVTRWPWKSYVAGDIQKAPDSVLVSEIGSLSLEFTRLSQLTGDNRYYDAVQHLADGVARGQDKTKLPGMWPVVVDASGPKFDTDNEFTLGGMSDSLYEYLPKQYMILGGLLSQPKEMYEKFIAVAHKYMFFRVLNPENKVIMLSGDAKRAGEKTMRVPRGQHLTCFTGGMVAIASKIFNRTDELKVAKALTDGCVWAYESFPHGIAPEIFNVIPCEDDAHCTWSDQRWYEGIHGFDLKLDDAARMLSAQERRLPKGITGVGDPKYILRPEAIESVFIMYRITGDVEWQNKAYRMFQAIEKVSRTEIAASAVADVTISAPQKTDSMESFWLAETLKYFYLIFADFDMVSLDKYVLNTEAHPLLRPS